MTEYVATRWYRAPEVIISSKHYANAIDIWSVGCIFAELIGKTPLFSGKDFLDQINKIINIMGSPCEQDLIDIPIPEGRNYILSLGYKPKIQFSEILPSASPQALDLLEKLLTFNPSKRITATEAINHPFFNNSRIEEWEKDAQPFNFENMQIELNKELNRENYTQLVLNEIYEFHPELFNIMQSFQNQDPNDYMIEGQ